MLFDAHVAANPSYRVLARAYRPQSFDALVGQDLLVSSLRQALNQGRLPHAFIFTGIRGVGKTTTARILARCLNCAAGPTIEPCGTCQSCLAIQSDRHIDVIEIDAASRTGVDDMRELIEAGRYRAVAGRYKIFIIDEVHMLSKSAFNALLKTLEEPPAHLVFIFATTEIEKVPSTILSRCMRCELKRISTAALLQHFQSVAEKEGAILSPEAAEVLARAADGSVRDGLSLLDQAITLSGKNVTLREVQSMLGLMDRGQILDLLDFILNGNLTETLKLARQFYRLGASSLKIAESLLEAVHTLTMVKTGQVNDDLPSYVMSESLRLQSLSRLVPLQALMVSWQHLILSLTEIQASPQPELAFEMALVRLLHACEPNGERGAALSSDLQGSRPLSLVEAQPFHQGPHAPSEPAILAPSPAAVSTAALSPAAASASMMPLVPSSPEDVMAILGAHKEVLLAQSLKHDAKFISISAGEVRLSLLETAPADLPRRLAHALTQACGQEWVVIVQPSSDQGQTLAQMEAQEADALMEKLRRDPLTQAAVDAFPGAVVHIEPSG